ncbi:helix-turn-helix domain-containing protein [Trinickia acidisoli]|uniref:helix-turn-helix domain-containing protein n=1 Tax=Trinickia acidisoli TaxID=2767482 RepID=UPI001A8C265F|nr:RodZ domain-containing protein [Trinickia acidisoli]
MSEPQHPQAEGTQTSAGRSSPGGGVAPQTAPGAAYAPLDSLAAVGGRLAQLREAKGWSVDDVSARLKVSSNKMRALEAGDISQLPGTTFALGVIRSYAKMLGTDPEPFAQALRRVKGESEPDLSMPASTGADLPRGRVSVSLGGTPKHRSWWWGVAAGVVVIIALAMWRQGGDSSAWLARLKASAGGMAANSGGAASGGAASASGPAVSSTGLVAAQSGAASDAEMASEAAASGAAPAHASSPAITPLETATAQPAASQPAGAQTSTAEQSAPAPASAAAQAQARASTQASEPAAQAATGASAPGASTIAVKVAQDSWFSVRDKSGKEVFSGLVHAGDTKEVSGVPPFKITAGNRAGLESMTLDGQPVDAAKFGPNKGNVARFTLP